MLILTSLWLLLILRLSHHPFLYPCPFTVDQLYGLKINDQQLFFPRAYGTEVHYCPSLDLSTDNLSDKRHIPEQRI